MNRKKEKSMSPKLLNGIENDYKKEIINNLTALGKVLK